MSFNEREFDIEIDEILDSNCLFQIELILLFFVRYKIDASTQLSNLFISQRSETAFDLKKTRTSALDK
jgi:hypothetical protein